MKFLRGFIKWHLDGLRHPKSSPAPMRVTAYGNLVGALLLVAGLALQAFGTWWGAFLSVAGMFAVWSGSWYILGHARGWKDRGLFEQFRSMTHFAEMAPHLLADEDIEMPEEAREAMQQIYRTVQETLGATTIDTKPTNGDNESP